MQRKFMEGVIISSVIFKIDEIGCKYIDIDT